MVSAGPTSRLHHNNPYKLHARRPCIMAEEKYHAERTTDKILEDLYRVVSSIDQKVEEILDEMGDVLRSRDERYGDFYAANDYYHDPQS